jgi:hypothetical protein
VNSKQKGSRGEREACKALREELGIAAERSQQYCGKAGDADIKSELVNVHFECKRTERFNAYDAIAQAKEDCGDKVPVVLHRRNNEEWLAVVPLAQLRRLVREIANLT